MPAQPVVVVLHDGRLPPATAMEPVTAHAELRPTEEAGLADALRGADVLFAYDFLSTAVPAAWHAAGSLQWIHVAAAGVDTVMSPEVRESDVVVTNSRGIFEGPIAEYVLAQVLALAKDLPGSLRLQREHRWEHRESERVAGTRALVVGTGPIGRAIARLLRAAGMEVHGGGRHLRLDDPDFTTVTDAAGLTAELGRADWVVAAAPLTEATRGMFDAAAFAAMAPHARFVNVGRGELVRTADLVTALRDGTIAGAALDVVDPEPLPAGHALWDLPNVVLTPHSSGDVHGWRSALTELFADNVLRWVEGRPLRNVVDKSLGYVPSTGSRP
ncbi:Phosphoglycerate dehydrogenase [Georgenia satyanarayanai]|uniref:Phosphoglycerate dehydrogenase n=1 Tax=Georgenia satyanarayanai TaxID=860221 RepID=A0A2Y9A3C9_9MICO|nr:D-2-hydroxyacid dehydrogenase [Georgenia satyanarayanai]PYG02188.1 phosphoglycerate dehydrogenase-like enzyme [Georgenia satyanarayanai]SSA37019.1 Phosphoglycerate dehydrogenase [Georgenia satyanarayanai]